MRASRREFIIGAGLTAVVGTLAIPAWAADSAAGLTSMAANARPITTEERLARIAKAQTLMRAEGVSALLIEAGSSLLSFTGIDGWRTWQHRRGWGQVILQGPGLPGPGNAVTVLGRD